MGCMSFVLLGMMYFVVDIKGWWGGQPFIYPGAIKQKTHAQLMTLQCTCILIFSSCSTFYGSVFNISKHFLMSYIYLYYKCIYLYIWWRNQFVNLVWSGFQEWTPSWCMWAIPCWAFTFLSAGRCATRTVTGSHCSRACGELYSGSLSLICFTANIFSLKSNFVFCLIM